MRSLFVATLLFFVALPLASVSAQHRSVASGCSCGCGAPIPAPMPVAAPCNTCNTCNTCNSCETTNACGVGAYGGCGSCGGSLCANPALFYQTLYAEFYARNPWYLEHKARESAARRARLYGVDPEAAGKPAPNKVAEPIKAP